MKEACILNQNRFTSPVVWAAVAAQLLTLLSTLGIINAGQSDAVGAVVSAVLQLLIAFGVLNNPTSKNTF